VSESIDELLDDAALMSFEHQEHLIKVLGQQRWDVTFQPPRFTFTGDRSLEATRFHVLGSAVPGPKSWLWSWANVLEAVFRLQLPDHRRAIHSYAVRRGLNPHFTDDRSVLSLTGPDFETAIRFNERGLVVATSTGRT
jgi:hypothetical protein